MIRFTRLKLHGFKSFVDNTELSIDAGMTGIVGPNGCGKSNLVEALRWVMGEASAKQMRGAEMDDVIFGGTSGRPPRSLAEVSLFLDNEQRTAPVAFNDAPEIEVTRRIERGSGSVYRCNGKEVRARDVQIMFADAASGARSTAMVTQGKVGELIGARPAQRRLLLEEAAGIAGLHARRHEAELRLKAAEGNLERLTDVIAGLETQLVSLRRQSKQAERYRSLSGGIRESEAGVLCLRWMTAIDILDAAKKTLVAAEAAVAAASVTAAATSAEQTAAAAVVPALRAEESAAAAAWQRLIVAIEQIDAEERRVAAAREQAERRLKQIADDATREKARVADAEAALARLTEEDMALVAASAGEAEAIAAAAAAVTRLTASTEQAEHALAEITARLAAEQSARSAANRRVVEARDRVTRLETRQRDGEKALAEARRVASSGRSLAEAEAALMAADQAAVAARAAVTAAEAEDNATHLAHQKAVEAGQGAITRRVRLKAEVDGLKAVLSPPAKAGTAPPVIDGLWVESGYEKALAAALGDDLSLPSDVRAAAFWAPVAGDAPEAGPESLLQRVSGDSAALLARRLAAVAVVADRAAGETLAPSLERGQRLVSLAGDLWRWDGLVRRAGAPSAAAARLEQRNRLTALEADLVPAEAAVAEAEAVTAAAKAARDKAAQTLTTARHDARALDDRLAKARATVADVARETAAAESRIAALAAQAETQAHDLAEARTLVDEAAAAEAHLLETKSDPAEQDRRRVAVAEGRAGLTEARSLHDRLTRDAADRRRRRERVAHDAAGWRDRLAGVVAGQSDLDSRRDEALEELQRLADRPRELAAERQGALDQTAAAEITRKRAADTLAAAEARLSAADQRAREAERTLSGAREDRVRAEAAVTQGGEESRRLAAAIAERLDCTPTEARGIAGFAPDAALPPLAEIEAKLGRLTRERDAMGPVNLRADQELEEVTGQQTTMLSERDDLTAAIARLRQGIAELNREGRQRLTASFEKVDTEFRRLFVRLFGGGRAHLALTESDDPLEAGLEIYASPPGKRLQVLSLLSGGEQAMTALALLFAVFLVNPAPICVLDEVDAPLDDANVDRFCTLLAEMSRVSAQATRFLVVTHHRMTMARMDRLYGVTMSERGVSRLVSVDLRQADILKETA